MCCSDELIRMSASDHQSEVQIDCKMRVTETFGGLQVVHWDRQSPGIRHDRADRLVDLYASGEQRSYGPLFLQRKMNISNQAFTEGDFSLSISDLQVCEKSHLAEIRTRTCTHTQVSKCFQSAWKFHQ